MSTCVTCNVKTIISAVARSDISLVLNLTKSKRKSARYREKESSVLLYGMASYWEENSFVWLWTWRIRDKNQKRWSKKEYEKLTSQIEYYSCPLFLVMLASLMNWLSITPDAVTETCWRFVFLRGSRLRRWLSGCRRSSQVSNEAIDKAARRARQLDYTLFSPVRLITDTFSQTCVNHSPEMSGQLFEVTSVHSI